MSSSSSHSLSPQISTCSHTSPLLSASQYILPPSPNWYSSHVVDANPTTGWFVYACKNIALTWKYDQETWETPRLISHFRNHHSKISALGFSHTLSKENLLASVSSDGVLKLWEANSLLELSSLSLLSPQNHSQDDYLVQTIAWSHHHHLLACGDSLGRVLIHFFLPSSALHSSLDSKKSLPSRSREFSCLQKSKDPIFSLSFSKSTKSLLAIGTKTGVIYLVSIQDNTEVLLHKLRGHRDEIHSLSWSPPSCSPHSLEFLVSSSKDKSIIIWNPISGTLSTALKIPKPSSSNPRSKHSRTWTTLLWPPHQTTTFFSSCPTSGDLIEWTIQLSCPSSPVGESLSDKSAQDPHSQLVTASARKLPTSVHTRIIFSACFLAQNSARCMTISMDRTIAFWDLESFKCYLQIPTLGGYAYSVSSSEMDPGRLAIGLGDNTLRIWNISKYFPSKSSSSSLSYKTKSGPLPMNPQYDCTALWKGLHSKVTAVMWHPLSDSCVFLGLEDGHVCSYDIYKSKSDFFTNSSQCRHKSGVYSFAWNSLTKKLYSSSADGQILEYSISSRHPPSKSPKTNAPKASLQRETPPLESVSLSPNPIISESQSHSLESSSFAATAETLKFVRNLNSLLQDPHRATAATSKNNSAVASQFPKRSGMTWNMDCSLLAVANCNGSLEIFDGNFVKLADLLNGKKSVTCLQWNLQKMDCVATSKSFHILASGSDDSLIRIFKVPAATDLTFFETSLAPFRILKGHQKRVSCLCWNPTNPNLLASGSYDGTVQIWNISLHTHESANGLPVDDSATIMVANFLGHFGRIFAILWCLVDPNHIISCSDDQTVRVWNYKNQSQSKPPSSHASKDKTMTPASTSSLSPVPSSSMAPIAMEESHSAISAATPLCQTSSKSLSIHSLPTEMDSLGKKVKKKKKSKPHQGLLSSSSLEASSFGGFQVDRHSESLQSCLQLFQYFHSSANSVKSEDLISKDTLTDPTQDSNHLFKTRNHVSDLIYSQLPPSMNTTPEGLAISENHICFSTWLGNNIQGLIDTAIASRSLTQSLVALSPSLGYQAWKRTSLAYSRQICGSISDLDSPVQFSCPPSKVSSRNIHWAVATFLSCHHVREALLTYLSHGYFMESLALAKLRLHPSDSFLQEIYLTWGHHCEERGNFELAFKCYTSVGLVLKALKCLVMAGDLQSYCFAVDILFLYLTTLEEVDQATKRASIPICIKYSSLLFESKDFPKLLDLFVKFDPIFHCKFLIPIFSFHQCLQHMESSSKNSKISCFCCHPICSFPAQTVLEILQPTLSFLGIFFPAPYECSSNCATQCFFSITGISKVPLLIQFHLALVHHFFCPQSSSIDQLPTPIHRLNASLDSLLDMLETLFVSQVDPSAIQHQEAYITLQILQEMDSRFLKSKHILFGSIGCVALIRQNWELCSLLLQKSLSLFGIHDPLQPPDLPARTQCQHLWEKTIPLWNHNHPSKEPKEED